MNKEQKEDWVIITLIVSVLVVAVFGIVAVDKEVKECLAKSCPTGLKTTYERGHCFCIVEPLEPK